MRARENALQFAIDILAVGDGIANDADDMVEVPATCIVDNDLVSGIFGEVIRNKQYDEMSERAILAPYNIDVNEHNDAVLNMLDEQERTYYSVDSTDKDSNNIIQTEVLNHSESAGMPPTRIRLKRNCIVMLIRNLNIEKGLCNGTRLRILDHKR
jgi:hypothetical protein